MNNHIRDLRTQLRLTQADLAARVGVRRETIVFLEQGKYNPSLLLAHAIAKALNSHVEAVFDLE